MDELLFLREKIDEIDEDICKLLKKRFSTCKDIKKVKAESNKQITDISRESVVYEHIASLFEDETQKNCAMQIYQSIIKQCKIIQETEE